jgi:hypothetical protein
MAQEVQRRADSRGLGDAKSFKGRVVYIYTFDLAYETAPMPESTLLGRPLAQFSIGASKQKPRHLFFYTPRNKGGNPHNAKWCIRRARMRWLGLLLRVAPGMADTPLSIVFN